MKKSGAMLVFSLVLSLGGPGWSLPAGVIAIRGGEIHTLEGKVIGSGTILIKDGKIIEVGENVQVPADAEIIDGRGYALYPGFIAASGFASASSSATAAEWKAKARPSSRASLRRR